MQLKIKQIKDRLEYLRGEIRAERISYSEIVELQSLRKYIKPDDVELLEWADDMYTTLEKDSELL